LPNVINLTPSRPAAPTSPIACAIPLPPFPYTPVECASSSTTHCLSLGMTSSISSRKAGKHAKSPSIEYRLSTARNTTPSSTLEDGPAWIRLNVSLSESGSLCLNAIRRSGLTRDDRIPECTLAWMSSSYTTQSPGCGTVPKNETFASQPELNSSAAGELKKSQKRDSKAECGAVPPLRSREPVEPSI
jgi:hypothetical protein